MIKRLISEKAAATALLALFSALVVFHVVALLGVIPRDMLWGGRIKSAEDFYVFEAVSLTLNAAMLFVTAVRAKVLKIAMNTRFLQLVFGLMFVLFAANTLGNIVAVNMWERIIFTPVTLILSLLSLRLAFANN
jgi:hypothetical protein